MGWPIAIVAACLVIGSIIYNEWVALVNHRSHGDHPLAAAEVAVGVFYTLLGAWLVDGMCLRVETILICFIASGTPMLVGDIMRWMVRHR